MSNLPLQGGTRSRGMPKSSTVEAPLVSIVTVVYNGAATLERTIQSVRGQSYPHIEYIIIDGGSTDGTLDIIRRNEEHIDLWISERDKGIYDAMNKGIALCTGQWVGMINADDHYLTGAVERVMNIAAHDPEVVIIHGDILILYPNGGTKVKRARISGFLLKYWEMTLNHPSFFVRRNYYDSHPYDPELRVTGDHHWTLRAWMEDRAMFHYLPHTLAVFSAGGASMVMPIGNALRESANMYRKLGLGSWHSILGAGVKLALHLPRNLKLKLNQWISSDRDPT